MLPGRNPALLAKELASLDVLCDGRFLPAFGLGIAHPAEQQAFGIERADRAPWFEEALPLLRRFWTEDAVDHAGARFHYEGLRVRPHPVQQPPDIWLGGRAPAELRRVGRLADGWLASFSMPAETAAGRATIEAVAADHGRTIDPEHFGAMIIYSPGTAARAGEGAARDPRRRGRPVDLVPGSLDALERRIVRIRRRRDQQARARAAPRAHRLARRARADRVTGAAAADLSRASGRRRRQRR